MNEVCPRGWCVRWPLVLPRVLVLAAKVGVGAACATISPGTSGAPPVATPSSPPTASSASTVSDGVFTSDQVSTGKRTFQETCVSCHTAREFSGALFMFRWSGLTAGDIFDLVSTQMPEDNPGSLRPEEYAAVLAYMLSLNGYSSGENPLPANVSELQNVRIEAPEP